MKNKEISVTIQGRSFSFVIPSNLKNEDFYEIIDYVNEKYGKIREETEERDAFRLGILSSLNLAEELFSLKKENMDLKRFLEGIDKIVTTGQDKDLPRINIQPKKT